MKVAAECRDCLRRLVRQAAALSTDDEQARGQAIAAGLRIVDEDFHDDVPSIAIATQIHQAIKTITGNPDPYRRMKDEEVTISRELLQEISPAYAPGLKGYLALSVCGNAIDFFRDMDTIKRDVKAEVMFALDDSRRFEEKLKKATGLLFLADNAGEVFFDLPLVRWLRQHTAVTYVVKEHPVQNDLTLDDLKRSGLLREFDPVITTGTATPGVLFDMASSEFKTAFRSTELILAKGMGYYEALTELPDDGRVLYLLKAKCAPVADSLRVALGSNVAMLR